MPATATHLATRLRSLRLSASTRLRTCLLPRTGVAAWGLLLALFSLPALSQSLPQASLVPGGVALIPLPVDAQTPPAATFNGRPVMVVSSRDSRFAADAPWVAVVGLGLDLKPGPQHLHSQGQRFDFQVEPKHYQEQRLTIKNKRQVNPNPDDLKRINREKEEILGALARRSDTLPVLRFIKPAQGPYSSPFGLRRFFNGEPRRPHSGLDIAAPQGSPIVAPAPGVVVATGDYFFNGRSVILDHGLGLTTMYNHMERIDVRVGQPVDTGAPLGTIGSTGRVTGPHLHWSVSLNNERVDPMLFLPEQP